MAQVYTERALYTQLAHYSRLLSPEVAFRASGQELEARQAAEDRLQPIAACLELAWQQAQALQSSSAHRWTNLASMLAPPVG